MALIDKIFGKKEKTLTELSAVELRREEILITKDRDKLFKKMETVASDKDRLFKQGAAQKSPELRKAIAMQFELKTQEQTMVARQLTVRSKELLTVSRVRMMKENQPKASGAMGRLNLTQKDVERLTTWIEDDAVTQDVYNERLDELLGMGASADKDAMERSGVSSTGQELINLWNDMDQGNIKEDQAMIEADKAMKKKSESMEKNL